MTPPDFAEIARSICDKSKEYHVIWDCSLCETAAAKLRELHQQWQSEEREACAKIARRRASTASGPNRVANAASHEATMIAREIEARGSKP